MESKQKPWFLVADNKGENEDARRRLLHKRLARIHRWTSEARELVAKSDEKLQQDKAHEFEAMGSLSAAVDLDQEMADLKLEGIAAIFDYDERKAAKRRRQVALIRNDHAAQRRLQAQREAMFEALWNRSHERQMKLGEDFFQTHRVLKHLGQALSEQGKQLLTNTRTAQVAKEERAARGIAEGPAASAGVGTVGGGGSGGSGAASVSSSPSPAASLLFPSFAHPPPASLAPRMTLHKHSMSSNLQLINRDRTVVHNALPVMNPEWGVVHASAPPRLLQRELDEAAGVYLAELNVLSKHLQNAFGRKELLDCLDQIVAALFKHRPPAAAAAAAAAQRTGSFVAAAGSAAATGAAGTTESKTTTDSGSAAASESAAAASQPGAAAGASSVASSSPGSSALSSSFTTGTYAARVARVREDLTRLGYPEVAALINEEEESKRLREVIRKLLDHLERSISKHGRFYFEAHCHSEKNAWVIGFARPPFPDAGFSFTDGSQASFGLCSDGAVLDRGARGKGLGDLKDVTVIGVLLDLHQGSVHFSGDGSEPVAVFGKGSVVFDEKRAEAQRQLIVEGLLLPTFALQGARLPPQAKSTTTSTTTMSGGGGGGGFSPYYAGTRPIPPSGSRTVGAGSGFTGGPGAGNRHFRATHTTINHGGTLTTAAGAALGKPLTGYVRPQISVNFGSMDLLYMPKGALPANTIDPPLAKGDPADAPFSISFELATRAEREALERKQELDLEARLRQADEDKHAFLASLQQEKLLSWSNFPPRTIRVHQAVLKVQRIARRFIGFKRRKALWKKLGEHATVIQRTFRDYLKRRLGVKSKAVVPIQAVYRGWKARQAVAICKRYKLNFADATRYATKIQSIFRMRKARKAAVIQATVLSQKLEGLRATVVFVQRMFRRKVARKRVMTNRRQIEAALVFQKAFRGARLRRMLAQIDPKTADSLRTMATSAVERRRRWKAVLIIQRIFRGWKARLYARLRRQIIGRDMGRLAQAVRAHALRAKVDRLYKGPLATHFKTLLSLLKAPEATSAVVGAGAGAGPS